MISPIFLNRTVMYMRHRMSRNHKGRKDFKVDSMLGKLEEQKKQNVTFDGEFLNLIFLGYVDKEIEVTGKVKVEVSVIKKALKKRKEQSDVERKHISSCETLINPQDASQVKVPAISIPASLFGGDNFQLSTYSVLFRIEFVSTGSVLCQVNGSEEEQPAKRIKLGSSKTSCIELAVVDRNGPCLLTEGEYAMTVQDSVGASSFSPKKLPQWESCYAAELPGFDDLSLMEAAPSLKFYLLWTKERLQDSVPYPKPAENGEAAHHNNNNNNINPVKTETETEAGRSQQKIIYQFLYNNNSRQQTETVSNLDCPWCSLNCHKLRSLVKHLKLCHARFVFNYYPEAEGARIDVAINEAYDGSYTGAPHDLLGPSSFTRSSGPKRRSTVTNILVSRPRRSKGHPYDFLELEENDFDSNRPYISGHNRLYHHTMTCLPVLPKELDIDSEGENDPEWLQYKTAQMIDEFTDVNPGEKEIMKMWNLHVMKYGYVGDVHCPLACRNFLQENGDLVLSKNLYRNFIIHMSSLFDYGLISPEVFFENIKKLQEMIREKDELKQMMKEKFAEQETYWLTTGIHKHLEEQKRLEEKKAREKEEEEKRKKEEKDTASNTAGPSSSYGALKGAGGGGGSNTKSASTVPTANGSNATNNANNKPSKERKGALGRGKDGATPVSSKSKLEDSNLRRRSAGSITPMKVKKGELTISARRRSLAVTPNILDICKFNPKIVLTRRSTQTTNGSGGRTRSTNNHK